MKYLITTIAAVVLVGCGESQQSAPAPESNPVEPITEAANPEPPNAKAPDISIHRAVENGNIKAVKQYLAAGVDVNIEDDSDRYKFTPLLIAAQYNQMEIAKLLIDKGANVNVKDADGDTPLKSAAYAGHKEIVELLIAYGADVNLKHSLPSDRTLEADTPLHEATGENHKEIVELLIANGADVNARNDFGSTPLDYAITIDLTKMADLLRKNGAKTGEELKTEAQ